jgi:hypothetical protein
LRTSDALYMLREIQTKTVARRGRISDIVNQIASENGIQDTVVEQTSGDQFLLIQSFMSDHQFIEQRCLPRASGTPRRPLRPSSRGNAGGWKIARTKRSKSGDGKAVP